MKRMVFFLLLAGALASLAVAEVNVNINIGIPAIKVSPDPVMTVIPGTYIYFITESPDDVFFYQGFWWRLHKKRWHRADGFNGPWVFLKPAKVPPGLRKLPPGWRKLPPGHPVLKHSQVKNSWKQWEKEKRWDKKTAKANKPAGKEMAPKGKGKK